LYEVQKEPRRVQLFDANGSCWTYRSLQIFVDEFGLYWIQSNCGDIFHTESWERTYSSVLVTKPWNKILVFKDWYMLRFEGEVEPILAKDIPDLLGWETSWRPKKSKPWHLYDFRDGPVEGIHSYRGGRYQSNPRTTQERRWAVAHDYELQKYGMRARSKRNFTNLISSWDREGRKSQKSWKNQRKTQWKIKTHSLGG